MPKEESTAVVEMQRSLLQKYCTDAEETIAKAPNPAAARALRDELCKRFASECDSELVIHATRTYIDRIIVDRWKEQAIEPDLPLDIH